MPAQPQDRKVAQSRARKAEAASTPAGISFDFDGESYSIDAGVTDDLELLEHVEDEKYVLALRGYLGREQWDKFKNSHRDATGRVSAKAVVPLMEAVMGAVGQGNS